jgi:hypothetical protein
MAANDEYEKWSGGSQWLGDAGVESLLATTIARKLFDTLDAAGANVFVTLETPFEDVAAASRAAPTPGRNPQELQGRPRADIVVWQGERPFAVIEVKRGDAGNGIDWDCDRVARLLERYGKAAGGALSVGCVIAFMWRSDDPNGQKLASRQAALETELADWSERARLHPIAPDHSPADVVGREYADWSKGGVVIELY